MQLSLPDILRKIRLDRKLSQENVAEELKVDATTYGRYEQGKTQIKFEQVALLADFYGVSLDQLYHYGDPEYSETSEPYAGYVRRAKVVVSVELDGLDSTLNEWVSRLTKINSVI